MRKKTAINVISSEMLKTLLRDVSTMVADTLKNTFGPYGQSTLIQTTASVYSTKDGWNVMQNLRITDENGEYSIAANAIKKLIQDVAQSVVLNAGDGTTTSILAADKLNNILSEYVKKENMDSRTIENCIKKCKDMIIAELQESAIQIDDTNMAEVIYQIALISTNWDVEISEIIRDIYVNTHNPIIKVEDSGNLETYASYIEGYDLIGHLELPNYYLTSPAKGLCEIENPIVLTFGSAIHNNQLMPLVHMAELLASKNETIVLLAPSFDLDFLNTLKAINAVKVRNGAKVVPIVPFKYFAKLDVDKDAVEDFATLVGGTLLTDNYEEVNDLFAKLVELTKNSENIEDAENVIAECTKTLFSISGTCEKIVATDKYILASGLTNKNEKEFARRKENLENQLEIQYKKSNAESSLTDGIRVKRIRLGKMQCNMGVIKIGGFGATHLKAKKDAVDDATRACEVAYQDGYIVDGGIAIPLAATNAMNKTDDKLLKHMLGLFATAFKEVATILFNNRYNNNTISTDIVSKCMETGKCYNLITEKYDNSLITPVNVSKEILNGCMRLVLINATSNQFVFQNEDDLIRNIQRGTIYDSEDAHEMPDDLV